MAGTFADQATLAKDGAFIDKCRVALLFRAREITDSAAKQEFTLVQKMRSVLNNAGNDAQNMAWLVATGNATVAAGAPAIPADGDVQFAVNTFLTVE